MKKPTNPGHLISFSTHSSPMVLGPSSVCQDDINTKRDDDVLWFICMSTYLTCASACMKMNSHFLAKALCSRARFSWKDQSQTVMVLWNKVIRYFMFLDDYIIHSLGWNATTFLHHRWQLPNMLLSKAFNPSTVLMTASNDSLNIIKIIIMGFLSLQIAYNDGEKWETERRSTKVESRAQTHNIMSAC